MEPDIRKDVRLLLFWGIRSHDSGGMSEQGVFWEAPYPLRKAPLYFVQLLITILGRASLRPIHCCQSNEPRCPKGCRGSLCMRMPARTTAENVRTRGVFGKLLTHFVKRKLYFVQLFKSVLEATARQ